MKKYLTIFLINLCFISVSFCQEDSNLSIGFQSGYNVMGKVQAIDIDNGFPADAWLGYQWSEHFQTKLEYQWIKTEHAGGDHAYFHSVRIVPSYSFFTLSNQRFNMDIGLGYQSAQLSKIDTVGQMEILTGPSYSWNFLDAWSLNTNVHYSRSFDSFARSNFQQFEFGLGVSYQFGSAKSYAEKHFNDVDQDGVVNELDECSKTPFGVHVSKNGCPQDLDGDDVADYQDFCADTKQNIEVDEIGCPLFNPGRGVIDGIAFENDSPRMTESSKNSLLTVAENLKKFPNLRFVIEGYTSPYGPKGQRVSISKARAVSVMNILVSYGVPKEKLQAVGLGDQYPLTASLDQRDRILNERIEIKWKRKW